MELVAAVASFWKPFTQVFDALWMILRYSPYWAPPLLAIAFWHAWIRYVRAQFIASQEYVLLEIKLPQEVRKTPLAMQGVLDGLHMSGGETTFLDRILHGKVRTWYSLELVSIEGQVHFYVWTRKAFQRQVERSFYAYYPDVEVAPVDDYALTMPVTLSTHDIWGSDFTVGKADAIPIKTYVDYGLDKASPKEEEKVDPMAGVLELLASMGKGESMWIQILVRAHRREDLTFGRIRNESTLEDRAKSQITRIRGNPEQQIVLTTGETAKTLSQEQMDTISSINRSVYGANHFDTGIRGMYIAEKDHFDGTNISALIGSFKQFGAPKFNTIALVGDRWQARFDYPWQDYKGRRENRSKVQILDAYRRRSWFHSPYHFRHFVFTSEELATIYHLPGTVTPISALQRVPSARAEAPTNLPI